MPLSHKFSSGTHFRTFDLKLVRTNVLSRVSEQNDVEIWGPLNEKKFFIRFNKHDSTYGEEIGSKAAVRLPRSRRGMGTCTCVHTVLNLVLFFRSAKSTKNKYRTKICDLNLQYHIKFFQTFCGFKWEMVDYVGEQSSQRFHKRPRLMFSRKKKKNDELERSLILRKTLQNCEL